MDRCYKINNTWKAFDNDLENLTISNKNQFPTKLINMVTKQHLNLKFNIKPFENKTELKTDTRFFKLPYIGKYPNIIAYKFICANCKVCSVGKTWRRFITRINEHLQKDPKYDIFKHLQESRMCNNECNKDCFLVIYGATTEYQLKMKEAMNIKWIQPKLNKRAQNFTLSLTV